MTQNLTMPTSRKIIRTQDAVAEQLRKELRAKGVQVNHRRKTKRDALIAAAAGGRPVDLAEQARAALRERRVQRDLDILAGRV